MEVVDEVSGCCALELAMLPASLTSETGGGDWPRGWAEALSTQSAGVGGTGPRAATPSGGGRLVGGEVMGALSQGLLALCDCDREADGGGPGGGGGRGIVVPQRTCEEDRERAEVGVVTAGLDTARLAEGGMDCEASESVL